ncbi:MAG TPA: SDR family oxidoreductase, partial [Agitococcus sp.]|nr:SDR family oxidoreductase [Agitococcus sp.]
TRLCEVLRERHYPFKMAVRGTYSQAVSIGDIDSHTNWEVALNQVTTVVHIAARVHVMNDKSTDPLAEFRKVNVDGTLNLARQAASAGVRRFVFISSIKVNGEKTTINHPFCADDTPDPQDAYGISKLEAEQGLRLLSEKTGMEIVIIRPPLVYGSGVKANFLSMMRWLSKGVPLPLGGIKNKRSLVSLDNLVDLTLLCCHHPAAANQIFLVSDGEDLSTSDLLRRMGQALYSPARLIPVPAIFLRFAATLLGKGDVAQRLCESLQVDITKTQQLLNWNPPVSVDEGLFKTAQSFHNEKII